MSMRAKIKLGRTTAVCEFDDCASLEIILGSVYGESPVVAAT
jgi:hypothetical protein